MVNRIKKLRPGRKPLSTPVTRKGRATSLDEHVGYRLRTRRALLGISQERLAKSVGITFQQMQKYERGVNRVSAGRLFQFSKLLDVPLTYFFEDMGKGRSNPYAYVGGLSDTEQEGFEDAPLIDENILRKRETLSLVRLYYSLPTQAQRKEVLSLLRTVVARARKNPDAPLSIPRKHKSANDGDAATPDDEAGS